MGWVRRACLGTVIDLTFHTQGDIMKFIARGCLLLAWVPINVYAASACDSPSTQLDINACAGETHAKADGELNRVYAAYRKRLPEGQAQQLKQAQLAWIKFRDTSCVFESSGVETGSAHAMVYQGCLTAKTKERVQALKALSSCKEGDLSCPAPQ